MYSKKKKISTLPSTATHSKRHTRELDQFVVCNKQVTSHFIRALEFGAG